MPTTLTNLTRAITQGMGYGTSRQKVLQPRSFLEEKLWKSAQSIYKLGRIGVGTTTLLGGSLMLKLLLKREQKRLD